MPTSENMLTVCHGCRTLIDDRYYLMAVDRSWHLSCLKCFDCGISLEQERTCFARFGQIFCKDDYIKYEDFFLEENEQNCFLLIFLEDIVRVFVHVVIR